MKVLVIPMAAMAETSGSFSRAATLASDLREANIEVATCCAADINFKPIPGIKNYFLSVPMPLGLPPAIALHLFPFAQKSGLNRKKTMNSFEEVLFVTGNIEYHYLKKSVNEIRAAIKAFEPDIIYSEFNLSAIIAGKIEKKKIFISASFPTQEENITLSKYSKNINRILIELGLPRVSSCLELFSWADHKFVPSCIELEPFSDKKVIFCGRWKKIDTNVQTEKNAILVYMGNGTISQKRMVSEIEQAFQNGRYQVYIAGKGLPEKRYGQIQTASYFDFNKLLPKSLLFINHGGQNSIIDGLVFNVPQIICAGKIFERKYNAFTVEKNGCGISISEKDFKAEKIQKIADHIINDKSFQKNSEKIGKILLSLGGTANIIDYINE